MRGAGVPFQAARARGSGGGPELLAVDAPVQVGEGADLAHVGARVGERDIGLLQPLSVDAGDPAAYVKLYDVAQDDELQ